MQIIIMSLNSADSCDNNAYSFPKLLYAVMVSLFSIL